MTIREQIINNIGTNTLFKLDDVNFVQKDVLKSLIYRWSKTGDIKKYRNGCYYFPSYNKINDRVFYNDSFNFYEFIEKNYLYDNSKKIIGVETGQNYLSSYGVDTQISTKYIIRTNNLSCLKKIYKVDSETFVIKKSRVLINDDNAKYLAFLYALEDYDFLSINNRLYDNGYWKNHDAIKKLLHSMDKNTLFFWSQNFSSYTRQRLKELYEIA